MGVIFGFSNPNFISWSNLLSELDIFKYPGIRDQLQNFGILNALILTGNFLCLFLVHFSLTPISNSYSAQESTLEKRFQSFPSTLKQ